MEDQAASDSFRLTVQNAARHVIIEYPGNIVNQDKALETLGGAEALCRQLQVDGAAAARHPPPSTTITTTDRAPSRACRPTPQ